MSWKRIFFDNPVTLLDQYSEYVQEDRLERTEYGIWRNLKKYFMSAEIEDCQVGVEYDDLGNILIGKSKRDVGNYDPLILEGVHINDGRFGTFIANFLDEVDKPWKTTGPIFVGHRESVKIYGSITAENLTAKTVDVSNSTIRAKASDGWKEIYNIDIEYNNKERESNNMKFNFDFGSCENDNVRMSPYGIAIKNTDSTWVSYDAKSGNIIDVDIFNFDGGKYLFKMPVAVKDVKVGDTIIHQKTPVYVVEVKGTDITVIDPRAGDKKIILPVISPFGFSFITKVVSLLDGAFGTAPSNDNPFGSMLPFFLMSNSDKKGNDIDPLMMAMLLNRGNAAGGFQNPMMLALMCADQTNMRDVLPLMMLAGQGNTLAAPAAN
jgi:hypothetical protein